MTSHIDANGNNFAENTLFSLSQSNIDTSVSARNAYVAVDSYGRKVTSVDGETNWRFKSVESKIIYSFDATGDVIKKTYDNMGKLIKINDQDYKLGDIITTGYENGELVEVNGEYLGSSFLKKLNSLVLQADNLPQDILKLQLKSFTKSLTKTEKDILKSYNDLNPDNKVKIDDAKIKTHHLDNEVAMKQIAGIYSKLEFSDSYKELKTRLDEEIFKILKNNSEFKDLLSKGLEGENEKVEKLFSIVEEARAKAFEKVTGIEASRVSFKINDDVRIDNGLSAKAIYNPNTKSVDFRAVEYSIFKRKGTDEVNKEILDSLIHELTHHTQTELTEHIDNPKLQSIKSDIEIIAFNKLINIKPSIDYAAYRNQPIEQEAHETGAKLASDLVFEAWQNSLSDSEPELHVTSKTSFDAKTTSYKAVATYGSTEELPFERTLAKDDLGDFVGEGVEKKVYKVKGYDDKYVLAYIEYENVDPEEAIDYKDPEIIEMTEDALRKEMAELDRLSDEHGLRTVEHYGLVTVDGRPALVMENVKNGVSIKLNNFLEGSLNEDVLSKFNTNTLDDIYKLASVMEKDPNFIIQDLQFLLKEDGHILIHDPETVALEYLEEEQISKLRERMEDTVKKIAETAIESRSKYTNGENIVSEYDEHSPVDTWDKDRYLKELNEAFLVVPESKMKNYDHQVHVVSFNPKDIVYAKNTAALVAKHKSDTTLIFMDANGDMVHVYGKQLSQIEGKVRISIEGHGETQTLKGHTLEQIKDNILKIDSSITSAHTTDKVSFISCKIDTTTNPDDITSRFGHKIITALDAEGLRTQISVRTLSVAIDHATGQKEVQDGIFMYKKYHEGTYVYSIEENGEVKRVNAHPDSVVIEQYNYIVNNDGTIDVVSQSDGSIVKSFKTVEDLNNGIEMTRPTQEDVPPPLPPKKGTYSSEVTSFAKDYDISYEEASRVFEQPLMKFLQEQGEIDLAYTPKTSSTDGVNSKKTSSYDVDTIDVDGASDRSNHKGYTSGSIKFANIGSSIMDASSSLQGFIEADYGTDTGKMLAAASAADLTGSLADTIDGILANTKFGSSMASVGFGSAGGILAGAAGLVQVGMIGKDWDSYSEDQKIAAGIEMGIKTAGSLSLAASGIAMGVAAAKGITTGAAVVGPAIGAAAGAIALAISPLQILDFVEQGKRIDQLSDLGDIMAQYGYEGDSLLADLYGEKLAVEGTLMAVQTSMAVASSVVSVAAAATAVGAPVAVVVGVITGAIAGILEATKQPMLEDIANRYRSKIEDAGGAEVYFKKNTDAQLKQMFANEDTIQAFKAMQEAYQVDGIVSLNGVSVSDSALELAAVTKFTDEMRKANNYANLVQDGKLVDLDKRYLELNQNTGVLNINTNANQKLLIKFTTPLFAPGNEESKRTEKGKNDYYTSLVINGPDNYTINDSNGSNILESNDKYATILYDVDGNTVKSIHLNINANGGDDSYKADGGKTNFNGGDGIDTVVYNSEHIHGIILTSSNGKYNIQKYVVDADIVSEKLATKEIPYGKRTETVTYRTLEIAKKSYTITDTLENTEIVVGSEFNDYMFGDDNKNDYFLGRNGNDKLRGGKGDDTLDGGEGNDTLHGDDGIDNLSGGLGKDKIYAGNGNDIVIQMDRESVDEIYGGEGEDTLDLSAMKASNLLLNITFDSLNSSQTDYTIVSNLEGHDKVALATQTKWDIGSKFARNGYSDEFLFVDGATNANKLFWKQNVNLVKGHEYSFKFYATINNNVEIALRVNGRDVGSTVKPTNSSQWAEYIITFVAQEDGLQTIGLRDLKTDAAGNDFAIDDIRLYDQSIQKGVDVNLETQTLDKGLTSKDVINSFENINGTNYDDTIIGNEESNLLFGNDGDDYIDAKEGRDSINAGAGNDTILAGDNGDVILQADREGVDYIDGGEGVDTLELSLMSSEDNIGVTIDLQKEFLSKGSQIQGSTISLVSSYGGKEVKLEMILDNDFNWGDTIWFKFEDADGDLGALKIQILKDDNNQVSVKFIDSKYISGYDENKNSFDFETDGLSWSGYKIKNFTLNGETIEGELIFNQNTNINFISTVGDTIKNIENVNGTNYDDTIIGNEKENFIIGNKGDDFIFGGDGRDTLIGGDGSDTILGGNNNDIIIQIDRNSVDSIDGGMGIDTLDLSLMEDLPTNVLEVSFDEFSSSNTDYTIVSNLEGHDKVALATQTKWGIGSKFARNGDSDKFLFVDGATNANKLFWKQNVNLVKGHEYSFKFYATINNNVEIALRVNGRDVGSTVKPTNSSQWAEYIITFVAQEDGLQTIGLRDLKTDAAGNDFAIDDIRLIDDSVKEGVKVSLENESLVKGLETVDIIKSIENVNGSNNDDIIIGDSNSNILMGNAGNDILGGKDGEDFLDGGAGDDTIYGGNHKDIISQTDREGVDYIDGGDGVDTLDLSMMSSEDNIGVTVDLQKELLSKGSQIIQGSTISLVSSYGGKEVELEMTLDNDFNWGDTIWFKFEDADGDLGAVKVQILKDDNNQVSVKFIDSKYTSGYDENKLNSFDFETDGLSWSGYKIKDFTLNGETIEGELIFNQNTNINFISTVGDTIKNIENVNGTNYNDIIIGNDVSNLLLGKAGDDYIDSKGGIDLINAGIGNDTVFAGSEDDIIMQTDREGNDYLDGGEGNDTLELSTMGSNNYKGVSIDLEKGTLEKSDKYTENIITMLGVYNSKEVAISISLLDDFNWGHPIWVKFQDSDGDLAGVKLEISKNSEGSVSVKKLEGKYTSYSEDNLENFDFNIGGSSWSAYQIKDFTFNGVKIEGNLPNNVAKTIEVDLAVEEIIDTVKNIENVIGTKYDDNITGDAQRNILKGLAGDDDILSGAGDDVLEGGSGINRLRGEAGNDIYILEYDSINIIDDKEDINSIEIVIHSQSPYKYNNYEINTFRQSDDLFIEIGSNSNVIGSTTIKSYFDKEKSQSSFESIKIENQYLHIDYSVENQKDKTQYPTKQEISHITKSYFIASGENVFMDLSTYKTSRDEEESHEVHILSGLDDDIFISSDYTDIYKFTGNNGIDSIFGYEIEGSRKDKINLEDLLPDDADNNLEQYISIIGSDKEGSDVSIIIRQDLDDSSKDSKIILHDVGRKENEDKDINGLLDYYQIEY